MWPHRWRGGHEEEEAVGLDDEWAGACQQVLGEKGPSLLKGWEGSAVAWRVDSRGQRQMGERRGQDGPDGTWGQSRQGDGRNGGLKGSILRMVERAGGVLLGQC